LPIRTHACVAHLRAIITAIAHMRAEAVCMADRRTRRCAAAAWCGLLQDSDELDRLRSAEPDLRSF
jgi:hypothetical protein